jgi:uncharacterized protein YndB with AHSA1/START domain
MAEVSRLIDASPEEVFAVLADAYTYPRWVVGAQRIRKVEGTWPELGSVFHHVIGVWPVRRRDNTEVTSVVPESLLVLEARARPAGRAKVEFELRAEGPAGTEVRMRETAVTGPARFIPERLLAPLIVGRNQLTLRRLDEVVHGRR